MNYIYVGEFDHSLDAKNRLTLPAKWRSEEKSETYLAIPNPIGCITIYPPKMIQKLEEKIAQVSLGDSRGQKILTRLFSKADTFDYDKQGRIHLNEQLINSAKIKKNVKFVGNYVTFSIWNPELYASYISKDEQDLIEINSILKDLGL